MIPISLLWSVNFFFFALTLLFVWSKVYIVSKKIQTITSAIAEIEHVANELQPAEPAEAGEEAKEA